MVHRPCRPVRRSCGRTLHAGSSQEENYDGSLDDRLCHRCSRALALGHPSANDGTLAGLGIGDRRPFGDYRPDDWDRVATPYRRQSSGPGSPNHECRRSPDFGAVCGDGEAPGKDGTVRIDARVPFHACIGWHGSRGNLSRAIGSVQCSRREAKAAPTRIKATPTRAKTVTVSDRKMLPRIRATTGIR